MSKRPRPRPRPDWRAALEAFRNLMDDPDSTGYALDLIDAVDPDRDVHTLRRLRASADGRALLESRPSLAGHVADRSALSRLPDGSFGRAYVEFLERHDLNPVGLIALAESRAHDRPGGDSRWDDPDRVWMRDRSFLMHDLWHVLTGYDADEAGEAALLPFSWGQMGGRANALLSIGVFLRKPGDDLTARRRMLQSWRRSRRCAWLPALRYEELLGKPLDEVRAAVRLA